MFVDSHCHIYFEGLVERLPELLDHMREQRVSHALLASVDLDSFPALLALAEQHDNLFASVGVHPDHENTREPSVAELVEYAEHPKIVAIGETGLDYYRLEGRTLDEMEWQRERFRTHIRAARQAGKPLIIHTRASSADTIRLMREEGAEQALALNFHISLSGIVTFKSAADVQDVARRVPLERLLIETDSPYLAPAPYRGKTNEPAHVSHVGRFIAGLRGLDEAALGAATTDNFFRLFASAVPA